MSIPAALQNLNQKGQISLGFPHPWDPTCHLGLQDAWEVIYYGFQRVQFVTVRLQVAMSPAVPAYGTTDLKITQVAGKAVFRSNKQGVPMLWLPGGVQPTTPYCVYLRNSKEDQWETPLTAVPFWYMDDKAVNKGHTGHKQCSIFVYVWCVAYTNTVITLNVSPCLAAKTNQKKTNNLHCCVLSDMQPIRQ